MSMPASAVRSAATWWSSSETIQLITGSHHAVLVRCRPRGRHHVDRMTIPVHNPVVPRGRL